MAAPIKKIIILGHGEISNGNPSFKSQQMTSNVYFYCPPGRFLDRHFIPTFIEYILGQRQIDFVKQVIEGSFIEDKSVYEPPVEEHGKFFWDDYDHEHYLFSNRQYMFQMMYSNKVPAFAINHTDGNTVELKNLEDIFSGNPNITVGPKEGVEINGKLFLQYKIGNNAIVIVPKACCEQKIPLTEIITWAESVYGKALEFHWLACREPSNPSS